MTSFELSQKTVNLSPYPRPQTVEGEEREELTDALLKWLLSERGMIAAFSATAEKKRALIRAAMNERPAHPVPSDVLAMQDRLFWTESIERGIVEETDLSFGENGIGLWQGDITRLAVDGIVGRNDDMACVALSAVLACGRRVPEDVSVIGFDNSRISNYVTPALTSVELDRPAIARAIITTLDEMIAGGKPSNQTFSTKLIERQTT